MHTLRSLCGLLCMLSTQWAFAATPTWVVCYEDQEFLPFIKGAQEVPDENAGVLVDLVRSVALQNNIKLHLIRRPWKRCKAEVKNGKADALFAFIYTPQREQWVQFPMSNDEPDDRYIYQSDYPIFVHKESLLSFDGKAFNRPDATILSVPGYVATEKLVSMGYAQVMGVQPLKGLELVAKKRIDAYIVEQNISRQILGSHDWGVNVITLPKTFLSRKWYIAFSKQRYVKDKTKVEQFWSGVKKARLTEMKSYMQKYLSTPTTK